MGRVLRDRQQFRSSIAEIDRLKVKPLISKSRSKTPFLTKRTQHYSPQSWRFRDQGFEFPITGDVMERMNRAKGLESTLLTRFGTTTAPQGFSMQELHKFAGISLLTGIVIALMLSGCVKRPGA